MPRTEVLSAVAGGKLKIETAASLLHAQSILKKKGVEPTLPTILAAVAAGVCSPTAADRWMGAMAAVSKEIGPVAV